MSDFLTQLSSPDTGTSVYTYDSAGDRKTQTDARGVTSTYGYDALNRLTSIIAICRALAVSSCALGNEKFVPATCRESSPAGVGQVVRFRGAVGEVATNALHMDFGFGVDFSPV